MRRRAFIAALGSAAAWPLVGRAQQAKVWRVGYLTPSSTTDKPGVALFDTFRLKLRELGYVEGQNLKLGVRRAEGDYAKLPVLAAELVALSPDVIVGITTGAAIALQQATSSTPIVMAIATDPIIAGLVKTIAKPGGNITGVYNQNLDLTAKSLELVHIILPNAKRIAVLRSPNEGHEAMIKEAHAGARLLGVAIVPVVARTPADLDNAFNKMHNENCDALVVLADARLDPKIVELADKWRIATFYQFLAFVDMGGLMAYSTDLPEQFRLIAVYVDKVLKGASPADLPVEQPTKFELAVNLKTAKALGLTIPDNILVRAHKVIE